MQSFAAKQVTVFGFVTKCGMTETSVSVEQRSGTWSTESLSENDRWYSV